ncbi:MAG: ribose 5-phosphate isomerase B [SAR324 cluster bacterium]|uniref:Ribose 5-phosphate isomerase B n=1 Tax=SAR324 cluster bacterium TaxID=2024889 RepID=A0A2A4SRT0_9DELT|nr:MAG: ribose 5-phosphate isomerase B [SAR324 cluster bacterium]
MKEKIIIGSDHGGFALKETLRQVLAEKDFDVCDAGCFDTSSIHYPTIGQEVAERIAEGEFARGILICGTGIGMSLAANRVSNVRATLCHDHLTAKLSREHNNSNVLVLGARILGEETALDILQTWLSTEFGGGRHQERLDMIEKIGK